MGRFQPIRKGNCFFPAVLLAETPNWSGTFSPSGRG